MQFTAQLMRFPGKGGWHFVVLPEEPEVYGAFGRVPVLATVDGRSWETSIWKHSEGGAILPVPARIRRGKGVGERVSVRIEDRG